LQGIQNLHLSFGEKEILKKRRGIVHWRADANQPAQPAKRPGLARAPSSSSCSPATAAPRVRLTASETRRRVAAMRAH